MTRAAPKDPYRRIAGVYDRVVEPLEAGVRTISIDVLPPQPGWRVLDVGCGTGTGLERYLDAGCVGVGVDMSPAMLDQAAARLGGRAELHLTDGGPLPFDDHSFELVTTSMVLHEVAAEDRAPLLTEMARVARPGASLLITDFRFGSWRGWRGPVLRVLNTAIERVSGHYSGYRSFKVGGGVPAVVEGNGLSIDREKIVAGGNIAIYVVSLGRTTPAGGD